MATSYDSQPWTKLLSSIVTSSIWAEDPPTKVVWVTLLALMDSRTGYVGGSIPGLAQAAGVTVEQAERAIAKFLAPDRYSRDLTVDPEGEGRRLVQAVGGWVVRNAAKIRSIRQEENRREQNRAAQERWRRKQESKQSKPESANPSAQAEADTEPEVPEPEVQKQNRGRAARPDSVPEDLWRDFLALRTRKRAPLTATALRLLESQATAAGWTLADAIAECCARGWTGFRAEWVQDRDRKPHGPARTRAAQDHDYRQGGGWEQAL